MTQMLGLANFPSSKSDPQERIRTGDLYVVISSGEAAQDEG